MDALSLAPIVSLISLGVVNFRLVRVIHYNNRNPDSDFNPSGEAICNISESWRIGILWPILQYVVPPQISTSHIFPYTMIAPAINDDWIYLLKSSNNSTPEIRVSKSRILIPNNHRSDVPSFIVLLFTWD